MSLAQLTESRQQYNRGKSCFWVEPAEFCRLAVSNLRLTRCDDPAAGLRGLINLETGEQYLVDSAKLIKFQITDN